MKFTHCLLFALILCSTSVHAFSPADTIRVNAVQKKKTQYPLQPILIKTNPAAIFWGPVPLVSAEYRLMVEMSSSKNQSMQFGISYIGKNPIWAIFEEMTKKNNNPHPIHFVINGLRIQVANKFYLVKKKYGSPFGFYVAPMVSYSNVHISVTKSRAYRNAYYDITQFTANILAGIQVGRGKRLTVDVFGGIGYKNNSWNYHFNSYRLMPIDTKEYGTFYNSPIKLTLGLNFGWALY